MASSPGITSGAATDRRAPSVSRGRAARGPGSRGPGRTGGAGATGAGEGAGAGRRRRRRRRDRRRPGPGFGHEGLGDLVEGAGDRVETRARAEFDRHPARRRLEDPSCRGIARRGLAGLGPRFGPARPLRGGGVGRRPPAVGAAGPGDLQGGARREPAGLDLFPERGGQLQEPQGPGDGAVMDVEGLRQPPGTPAVAAHQGAEGVGLVDRREVFAGARSRGAGVPAAAPGPGAAEDHRRDRRQPGHDGRPPPPFAGHDHEPARPAPFRTVIGWICPCVARLRASRPGRRGRTGPRLVRVGVDPVRRDLERDGAEKRGRRLSPSGRGRGRSTLWSSRARRSTPVVGGSRPHSAPGANPPAVRSGSSRFRPASPDDTIVPRAPGVLRIAAESARPLHGATPPGRNTKAHDIRGDFPSPGMAEHRGPMTETFRPASPGHRASGPPLKLTTPDSVMAGHESARPVQRGGSRPAPWKRSQSAAPRLASRAGRPGPSEDEAKAGSGRNRDREGPPEMAGGRGPTEGRPKSSAIGPRSLAF